MVFLSVFTLNLVWSTVINLLSFFLRVNAFELRIPNSNKDGEDLKKTGQGKKKRRCSNSLATSIPHSPGADRSAPLVALGEIGIDDKIKTISSYRLV